MYLPSDTFGPARQATTRRDAARHVSARSSQGNGGRLKGVGPESRCDHRRSRATRHARFTTSR
jgi:hypothetical protein